MIKCCFGKKHANVFAFDFSSYKKPIQCTIYHLPKVYDFHGHSGCVNRWTFSLDLSLRSTWKLKLAVCLFKMAVNTADYRRAARGHCSEFRKVYKPETLPLSSASNQNTGHLMQSYQLSYSSKLLYHQSPSSPYPQTLQAAFSKVATLCLGFFSFSPKEHSIE